MELFQVKNNTSLRYKEDQMNYFNIHREQPFKFQIKPLTKTAKAPKKALEFDNGYDLFLCSLTDHVEGEDEQFSFDLHTTGCDPVFQNRELVGIDIHPGGFAKLPLGFASAFDPYWGGFVFDKSGVGAKGLKYLGGVIEGTYRNAWWVMLANIKTSQEFKHVLEKRDDLDHKDNTVRFLVGQKIAQVCFLPVGRPEVEIVDELDETERKGGFNSTGSF